MATKRALIAQALDEIGIAEYIFDATPEQLESARLRLNRIAAQWDGIGVRVGYNLGGGLDDESGIPDTAENCFALHLGIAIAPGFGKAVSQDTKNAAAAAWNALYVARRQMPVAAMPSNMPRGTGQRAGVMEGQYFPKGDGTVEGLDAGATEY